MRCKFSFRPTLKFRLQGGNSYQKNERGSEVKLLILVRLFATPWTVAYQVPPPMGFFRQEFWTGLPFPFPGDLPKAGIEPGSPALQADALPSESPGKLKRGKVI